MSLIRTGTISSLDQPVSRKYYDEYDRIFGEWSPKGSIGKGKKDRMSILDDKKSSISGMMRDKIMIRMIREGKANDRGLKREAELIERENTTRPQIKFREQQRQKLEAARLELRRSQR